MRYFVIVNPTSGRGQAGKAIPQIEELLRSHNLDFKLVQTERPWHAAELAEAAAAEGYDVVATASGDGTANEVLNGLMRARAQGFNHTAFTVLPVGTGNDMLFGLGQHHGLEDGVQALVEGQRRRIDVGFVRGGDYPEGRYFANGIGIGFDAMVGFEAIKVRWAVGIIPYLIGVVKTIFLYFNAPLVEITIDDKSHTQRSLMTSIMNGRRMGGGFLMAPEGDPTDGHLNLCIASEATRIRLFQLIPYFIKGTQAGQPEISMEYANTVKVRAIEGSLPAHADGEMLCVHGMELEVELIPAALDFVTLKTN